MILLVPAVLIVTGCNNHEGNIPDKPFIPNKVFTGDDTSDFVENETWSSTISLVWNGTDVTLSGEAEGVSVTASDGYVSVSSSAPHVTYAVSGNGTGQLSIYSRERFQLSFEGLTLSCPNGPAVNIQSIRTCYAVLNGTNTLSDGATYTPSPENRKAAFFSEGNLCFSGSGNLTITGNHRHALASDAYIRLCAGTGTVNLIAKISDGMHTNDGVIINDGTVTINAVDEGIQCDQRSVLVTGGKIIITSQMEGMEAKGAIEISGGEIAIQAKDDAINSGQDLTINGGYIMAYSTDNDGIDANGNCYINGGVIYAIGTHEPETAIDVNSEQRKQLYVQGGTLVAIGGLESGANLGQTCYSAASLSKDTWYALYSNDEAAFVFKTPSNLSSSKFIVSTGGTTSLQSSVTTDGGTSILNGYALSGAAVSGGTAVALSAYTDRKH